MEPPPRAKMRNPAELRARTINPPAEYAASVRSARAIPYWDQPPGLGRIGTELASRLPLPEDFQSIIALLGNIAGAAPGPMFNPMAGMNLAQMPSAVWQDFQQHPAGNVAALLGLPPGLEGLAAAKAGGYALPPLMTAFHGTPHRFAPVPENPLGAFDLSKIGTGEGAQAYGHGIYLAENPQVAREYRPPPKVSVTEPRRAFDPSMVPDVNERAAGAIVQRFDGDVAAARDYARNVLEKHYAPQKREITSVLDRWVSGAKVNTSPAGTMYRVDLPDEQIARMLDWDAPWKGQQPIVQDAVTALWRERGGQYPRDLPPFAAHSGATGESIYNAIGTTFGGAANDAGLKQSASTALSRLGIPGLQYLDQGSRAAGQGTRNFVVWNPDILRILGIEP